MVTISALLADPGVRDWYLAFCLMLFAVPMIWIAVWYHRSISRSSGGRDLMKRQSQSRAGGLFLGDSVGLVRDINAGRYGEAAKLLQNRLYVLIGLWLVVNAVTFGLLIWADEINRVS